MNIQISQKRDRYSTKFYLGCVLHFLTPLLYLNLDLNLTWRSVS